MMLCLVRGLLIQLDEIQLKRKWLDKLDRPSKVAQTKQTADSDGGAPWWRSGVADQIVLFWLERWERRRRWNINEQNSLIDSFELITRIHELSELRLSCTHPYTNLVRSSYHVRTWYVLTYICDNIMFWCILLSQSFRPKNFRAPNITRMSIMVILFFNKTKMTKEILLLE